MTNQLNRALAYSYDFLSFLFLQGVTEKINSVYLFGSFVRGETDKESDIDIFINCKKTDEGLLSKSAAIAERNFRASNDFDKWKLMGFVNKLSINIGQLVEWGLKTSIDAEGIELFSRTVNPMGFEGVTLFSFEMPKKKKDYLRITRELFGRKEEGYKSEGLVQKRGGMKVASNAFLVQKAFQPEFINLLHHNKISFRISELLRKSGE